MKGHDDVAPAAETSRCAASALLGRIRGRDPVPALHAGGRTFTWADLDDASRRCAGTLRARGVSRGDRVALFAHNSVDVVVALLANHRQGFVHVPINPGYESEERAHVERDSGAKLVLDDAALRELSASEAAPADDVDVADDELALLIYTSGTTGKSKGCMLSFGNVAAAVDALSGLWEISPADEVIHALPLFHVHGLCVALQGALLRGARTRLLDKFTPRGVVEAVAAGGTVFMGVPTMYRRLLDHLVEHPEDGAVLAQARLFTSGSAPLPAADLEEFERRTGHRIVERYGMSETLITLSNPLRAARKAGTVGKPIAGVEMRLVDDELQVRGPSVMRGYWQNPAATAATFTDDGWLKTGDLAAVDDDGYVTILGRASTDFLKVGGYKISTREIEERIARVPGVVEVAVVGAPDREWGQRVVAVVAVDARLAALSNDALLATLQDVVELQAAKKPRAVVVVEKLPRNAMGKVQKKLLERQLAEAAVDAARGRA